MFRATANAGKKAKKRFCGHVTAFRIGVGRKTCSMVYKTIVTVPSFDRKSNIVY